MAKRSLAKLYDQLTGLERLRLVIEAQARGDKAEGARLIQSCPRTTYSCGDDEYTNPMKATFALVEASCHEFDRGMGRLQALDAVQFMISRLIKAIDELYRITPKRLKEIIETLEGLSEMQITPFREAMIAEIKTVHNGLGKFVQRKLEMTPDTLLKAFATPYWEWLEDLREEMSSVEVDPERVAEFERRLDKAWNLMIE